MLLATPSHLTRFSFPILLLRGRQYFYVRHYCCALNHFLDVSFTLGMTSGDCDQCKHAKSQDGECVAACPRMEFSNDGVCAPCDSQCATGCSGASPLECDGGLCVSVKTFTGACAQTCWDDRGSHPSGYFPALESQQVICRPCDQMCGSNAASCCYGAGTVDLTAAELGKTCGYLGRLGNNTTKCLPCDVNCRGCTGPSASQCLSCAWGEYDGVCVNKCPLSMIRSRDGVCQPCPEGTINQDDACVPCQEGAHYTDAEGKCRPCDSECGLCIGPSAADCVPGNCKNFQVVSGQLTSQVIILTALLNPMLFASNPMLFMLANALDFFRLLSSTLVYTN